MMGVALEWDVVLQPRDDFREDSVLWGVTRTVYNNNERHFLMEAEMGKKDTEFNYICAFGSNSFVRR